MSLDLQIDITKDTATAGVADLAKALASQALKRHVGAAATIFTQSHLRGLPSNKQGWPSQDFYGGAARGTSYVTEEEGVRISVDNENAPGAMKFAYNQGQSGKIYIYSNGKLLTVPARAQFYGHRAGEFTNLRFVMFKSGAKALVIGSGGTEIQGSKGPHRVKGGARGSSTFGGAGARSASMVAYWLTDSVEQDARPGVLPTKDRYIQVIGAAI